MLTPPDARVPRRVLVTGGAGFIGSALVWQLNALGLDRVVVADRLGTSDKWRNLAPLAFEDYLEAESLLDRLESGALGRFDLVLHMGACSSTLERDATFLVHNNFEFTKRLAHWSLAHEARFVYASSAATYGDGAEGMEDVIRSPRDLGRLRPLNAYGYSKQLFDQYALANGILDQIVGLKFFNVYGPNEAHKGEMRSLVQKAYEQVRETGRVKLFKSYRPEYADGEQRRDFVYVKDVVAMSLYLAMHPQAGGLFNIGSGIAHSWLDLTAALFAAMGQKPAIEFIEMPESMRDRYQYFTQADISRLTGMGFQQPQLSLTAAIADYIQGYVMPDKRLGDERIHASALGPTV
jgi:ADP-L-glycero-D-manno-heptose 6-epimerase